MKITVNEAKKENPTSTYPWIGISKHNQNTLFLFTRPDSGFFIRDNEVFLFDYIKDGVDESYYEPFTGEVVLSND